MILFICNYIYILNTCNIICYGENIMNNIETLELIQHILKNVKAENNQTTVALSIISKIKEELESLRDDYRNLMYKIRVYMNLSIYPKETILNVIEIHATNKILYKKKSPVHDDDINLDHDEIEKIEKLLDDVEIYVQKELYLCGCDDIMNDSDTMDKQEFIKHLKSFIPMKHSVRPNFSLKD